MALEGTIKDFSIVELLQMLGQNKSTGILVIKHKENFVTIYFEKGLIVNVETFPRKIEHRLGKTLLKRGNISSEILNKALQIQSKTGKKLGEILLGLNIISKDELKKALKDQASQIIISIMSWKEGEYKFQKKDLVDWDRDWFEPLSVDRLLMESMQILDEMPLIKEIIPDSSVIFTRNKITKKIKILDETEDEKISDKTIYLTKSEYEILKFIDGERDVNDLVEKINLSEFEIYKGLYNLNRKGIINKVEKEEIFSKDEKVSEKEKKDKISIFKKLKVAAALIIFLLEIISLIFTTGIKKNIFYPVKFTHYNQLVTIRYKTNQNFIKTIISKYKGKQP